MINEKTIADFMNTSPTSLKEFSDYINTLIKEHGRETIINNAGIDKNVLYRASNSQNITLDNYYKIKKAYNNQLTSTPKPEFIEQLPILGQIIDNDKVRMLNLTQPQTVPVPADLIKAWSPVLGYLCVSGTAYSGFVFIFSGKNLDNISIAKYLLEISKKYISHGSKVKLKYIKVLTNFLNQRRIEELYY